MVISEYERFMELRQKFVKENNCKPEQARLSRSSILRLGKEMKEFDRSVPEEGWKGWLDVDGLSEKFG